ncbi:MAG: penicillin-binding protein 1A [Thiotrichaceae bacterium]|nr:penicillin-binding protein 1A [Thiotrichaceae bacterium]
MNIVYHLYKISHLTLLMGLLLILLVSGIGLAIQWYFIPHIPSVERLKTVQMQVPLQIYTKDNVFITEYGEQHRIPVPVEQIPPLLIKAVLAVEDNRFYEHAGVDIKGLFRALVNLLKTGKKRQGGSTITMQVARNFFLSHKKTFTRKFNEILLALKIDETLSKDEILELYLNKIYFGHRAYGVGAAAQIYYGKNILDLNLAQWAMLAGLPKGPSVNNPLTNPTRALERRNYVLKRMLVSKYITINQYELAIKAPLTAKLHKLTSKIDAFYVAEMVRSFLLKKFGKNALYNGYKVFTTLDSQHQERANLALRAALFRYDKRHGFKGALKHLSIPQVENVEKWADDILQDYPKHGDLVPSLVLKVKHKNIIAYNRIVGRFQIAWKNIAWARPYIPDNKWGRSPKSAKEVVKRGDIIMAHPIIKAWKKNKMEWRLSQIPEVQGAFVALNTKNGAVLGLAGGFNFRHSQFNRVTQALRQPGSSFKPFIFSAALTKGFSDKSRILDEKISFKSGGEIWQPRNSSHKYYGWTTLRTALTYSFNVSAVRLLNQIGIGNTINHLTKFGFDRKRIPNTLSLALGSGEVNPLQLAAGYAVFANGGFRVKPYFIERIEDLNGQVLFSANPLTICRHCPNEVLTSEKALLSDILVPHSVCTQTPRYAPQIISTHNAYMITSMLKDVIRIGTARSSKLHREDIAGKTGTTNDQRDAWFVGYSPDIVTSVWVGFDKPRSLGRKEYGGRVALPMWADFMSWALRGKPVKPFPMPNNYEEESQEDMTDSKITITDKNQEKALQKSTVIPEQLF